MVVGINSEPPFTQGSPAVLFMGRYTFGGGVVAYDISPDLPSLQSQVRKAEYRVVVEAQAAQEAIEAAIRSLLERESLPWEHWRDKELHRYDLRAQVHDLRLAGLTNGEAVLEMLLKTEPSGSGRPEQVVAALGLSLHPKSIHRTRLLLADPSGKGGR